MTPPSVSGWRAGLRGARLTLHVVYGLLLAALVKLDPTQRLDAERLAQGWSRHLLHILKVRITVDGKPPAEGHLVVANHVSWLDIFVLLSVQPARFVAKAEIRSWPIAGWMADALGTFYIRRGRGGTAALLERLRPHLAQGGTIVVFPEGTTSDGRQVLPFHPRLFAAAMDSDALIQPAALHYGLTVDGQNLAPFIGDDDLVPHIRRLLSVPTLAATLTYTEPYRAQSRTSREACAATARQHIEGALPRAESRRPPTLGAPTSPQDTTVTTPGLSGPLLRERH